VTVQSVRVVLVDDHPMFRDGLRKLLESDMGFDVCGEAGDVHGAVDTVRALRPDILLLDMAMPDCSGLEVLRLLEYESVPTRTLVLTASIASGEAVQALQLGARGLILKAAASQLLSDAIHAVLDGRFWVDAEAHADVESCLRLLLGRNRLERDDNDFGLTPRERDILTALVEGLSNRDIAVRCGVSEVTVKHHLNSVFEKCGMSNRVELVLFALRHGLARL
jgi:two-component system, NarL family, nitrate/nitrite response regulator NarL